MLAPGGVAVFQLPSHPLEPDDEHTRAAVDRRQRIPRRDRAGGASSRGRGRVDRARSTSRVRNASDEPWPADRFVNLGNHWRAADGTLIRNDDGRTSLPGTILPGAEVRALARDAGAGRTRVVPARARPRDRGGRLVRGSRIAHGHRLGAGGPAHALRVRRRRHRSRHGDARRTARRRSSRSSAAAGSTSSRFRRPTTPWVGTTSGTSR